jgi:biotin carboxyl carrier protein
MANYTITVNGRSYDVIVEKSGGVAAPQMAAPLTSAPVSTPVTAPPQATPAPAKPAAPKSSGGTSINAPMPGKVISVNVKTGDSVKKGQELIVVEAMKMHNPVLAATDGVVQEIFVKPGDPIQTGSPLISIS